MTSDAGTPPLAEVTGLAARLTRLLVDEVAATRALRAAVATLDAAALAELSRARGSFHARMHEALAHLHARLSAVTTAAGLPRATLGALREAGFDVDALEAALADVRRTADTLRSEDARTQAALQGALACTRAFLRVIEPEHASYGPRANVAARAFTLSRRV